MRHRDSRIVAVKNIGGGIADQDDVNTGLIQKLGYEIVIGGQHGDLFAVSLLGDDRLDGDFFAGFYY